MPIPFLLPSIEAIIVEPLPIKGSKTTSPTKLNSLIHLLGNSTGNGAGCPPAPFLLCPGKDHNPFVHSMNSDFVISDCPLSFFWQSLSNLRQHFVDLLYFYPKEY